MAASPFQSELKHGRSERPGTMSDRTAGEAPRARVILCDRLHQRGGGGGRVLGGTGG